MLIKNISKKSATILFSFGFNKDADIDGRCHRGFEQTSWFQFTPLMYASIIGNINLVAELIQAGVDLNIKDEFYGFTALMWAAHKGQDKVVEVLLQSGADTYHRAQYDGKKLDAYALSKKHSCCSWLGFWQRVDEMSGKANFSKTQVLLNLPNCAASAPVISPSVLP